MSHINNLQVICQINEFIQLIYILFLDFFKNFLLNITFFFKNYMVIRELHWRNPD